MPSEFLEMDIQEKAFIIAAIDLKCEDEKREAQKMNAKSPSKGGKKKGRRKR